jgi:peptidyl-prolyl cis-trans isomerase SurA
MQRAINFQSCKELVFDRCGRSIRVIGISLVMVACSVPALFSQSAGGAESVVLDEIVAKVNNEIITLTDLQRELRTLRNMLSQDVRDPNELEQEFEKRKKSVLKDIIDNKMLVQKAEELGLTANIDVEVAAYLEETRKQAGIPNMEVFDQALRQQGRSLAEHREWVKRQMIINNLIEQFVYSKLTLLTPEVEAYYKANIDRFTEPAEADLAEILFLTEGKDKAAVRRKAEEVLGRLKSGADFEAEAKQHSEGPTATRGGQIGTFKKGSMAASLDAVVFKLNPGETSGIVETDYGYQIVKLLDKRENQVKPLTEVRPIIQSEMYRQKAEPEYKEFLQDLRSQSYIYVASDYRQQYDVEGL